MNAFHLGLDGWGQALRKDFCSHPSKQVSFGVTDTSADTPIFLIFFISTATFSSDIFSISQSQWVARACCPRS